MTSYLITLVDHEDWVIEADKVALHESGALLFFEGEMELLAAYAHGEWASVALLQEPELSPVATVHPLSPAG